VFVPNYQDTQNAAVFDLYTGINNPSPDAPPVLEIAPTSLITDCAPPAPPDPYNFTNNPLGLGNNLAPGCPGFKPTGDPYEDYVNALAEATNHVFGLFGNILRQVDIQLHGPSFPHI
jgi:hypothetical protein